MVNAQSFKSGPSIMQYEKRPIPEILKDSETVDVQAAAKEILVWIANNVEQFIDNQKKMFKLDLVIETEPGATATMPEIKKLQDLYRAIPNDPVGDVAFDLNESSYDEIISQLSPEDRELMENIQNCKTILDSISSQIFEIMRKDEELLAVLFKRMGWYYELQGINRGELLLEEIEGEVDIVKLEYEAFPVSVQVTSPKTQRMQEDGKIIHEGGEPVNEYVVPEGFTIWLEIAFKSKNRETASLF